MTNAPARRNQLKTSQCLRSKWTELAQSNLLFSFLYIFLQYSPQVEIMNVQHLTIIGVFDHESPFIVLSSFYLVTVVVFSLVVVKFYHSSLRNLFVELILITLCLLLISLCLLLFSLCPQSIQDRSLLSIPIFLCSGFGLFLVIIAFALFLTLALSISTPHTQLCSLSPNGSFLISPFTSL